MGWIVPGLGHALQRMWGRALAIFLAVGFLVYLGAGMSGNLFAPGGDDAFARLGYGRTWVPAVSICSHVSWNILARTFRTLTAITGRVSLRRRVC